MGDPWADEGFGGEDDWEGKESVEADVEDELDLDLEDLEELEVDEVDEVDDDLGASL
jgi:hypothetical protein